MTKFPMYSERLLRLAEELHAAATTDQVCPAAFLPVVDEIAGLAGWLKALVLEYQRRMAVNVKAELEQGRDPLTGKPLEKAGGSARGSE